MSPMSNHGEWGLHKNTIHRLYIVEDRPLKEGSKTRFEQQLKTWGFSKNLQSDQWKAIGRKVEKRKRENKASDVVASGIRYPQAKVRKETSRNFYNTQENLHHDDTAVLDFIQRSGVIDPGILANDLILEQPTIGAFFEKVFEQAINTGQVDIHGLDPNLELAGYPLLHYVLSSRFFSTSATVLEMLLLAGADVHMESAPSHMAECHSLLAKLIEKRKRFSLEDFTKLVQLFVSKGFPIKQHCCERHGNTLQVAVGTGPLALVKSLDILDRHPLMVPRHETWDYRGMTFSAVGNRNVTEAHDMVQYLLSRYSSESDEAKLRLPPPLDISILLEAIRLGNEAIVRLCLASGVDINGEDEMGRFPLALAALKSYEMCKLLLQFGAWPDKTPGNFEPDHAPTALHFAAISGDLEVYYGLLPSQGDLQNAIQAGLLPVAEKILSLGFADIDERAVVDDRAGSDFRVIVRHREQDFTALEVAIEGGSHDAVALLLKYGATVTEDVLRLAVKLGHLWMVPVLVKEGTPITDTVFEAALETFYTVPTAPSISRYLAMITRSSDIQLGDFRHALVIKQAGINMSRTLLAAVQSKDHGLISDLVGSKLSSPVYPSEDGYSILREAILNDNHGTIDLFLQAYPTAYDSRSLLNVVIRSVHPHLWEKQLDIAQKLLDRRQPGTPPDRLEATAINIAVSRAEKRDHILLDLTLHLVKQTETWGYHPCHGNFIIYRVWPSPTLILRPACAIATESGQTGVSEKLLQAGYKPATMTGILASQNGYLARVEMVRLLLDSGANANARTAWGMHELRKRANTFSDPPDVIKRNSYDVIARGNRNALQFAVERGNLQIIRLLLDARAAVNAPPSRRFGATALQLAAIKGYIGIARLLISLGANVNAPGAKYGGRTALEGAAEHGRLDLVQLLLEEGALVEGTGRKQFIRAVSYAIKRGHHVLVNRLKSRGGWSSIDEHTLAQEDLADPEPETIIRDLLPIVRDEDDYESCDEPAGDYESDEDE
ncbi:hypothetical protein DL765_007836 [Monosporascus sp. GIB2]|nr:hypothetical protein DL765_007836 [Monosporascus sp. GIB2]